MSYRKILSIAPLSVIALLLAGSFVRAGEKDGECHVSKNISTLLASWKTAAAKAETVSAEEKARVGAKIQGLAKQCPVGSRLGTTLAAVRDSLNAVVACEAKSAKDCPLEGKAASDSAACAEGKKLKTARTAILGGLQQLASVTAGVASGECCSKDSACCASAKDAASAKAGKAVAATKGESCAKAAAGASASCPIRLASRLGELKSSWRAARDEIASLPEAKRLEITGGFASLSRTHQGVALVPPSVFAIADGLEALAVINTEMNAWAAKNPELMSSVPESAIQAYMLRAALVDEARQVLSSAREAMAAMNPELAASIRTASAN